MIPTRRQEAQPARTDQAIDWNGDADQTPQGITVTVLIRSQGSLGYQRPSHASDLCATHGTPVRRLRTAHGGATAGGLW
jgi:hypothetical protein